MSCSDVLVVGGGPAGLAAAIALRRRGMAVILADAMVPPIDKACGEGLMPDSRRELAKLGISITAEDGCEFNGIHFAHRTDRREDLVSAEFADGRGVGVRRSVLHLKLIECAADAGVCLRWGTHAEVTPGQPVRLDGELFRYRYLIGADGESSRVRRWAGLDSQLQSRRFGFRRHYRISPSSRYVEVHWGGLGQVYVTPVGDQEICVAAVTRHPSVHFDRVLEDLPLLRTRLLGGDKVGRSRGAVTTTRKLSRVTRGNVALLGDASGSADAITGEGLAMAFRQATLLGEALSNDCMETYEAGHAAILQRPQMMARMLLAMDRWPWLRDRGIGILADDPDIFARMLALHVGDQAVRSFVMENGFRLGWRLLRPSQAKA